MDDRLFDALARSLAVRRTRRAALSAIGTAFAGSLGLRRLNARASSPPAPGDQTGSREQNATPEASPVASPVGAPSFALVDAAALKAVAADLPADPINAVMALVDKIYDADDATAMAAVGEVLRRAAIPLVSTDGPVIGLPDRLVAVNVPIYVDFLRDLARSVRQGSVWDGDGAAAIFAGFGLATHGKPFKTKDLAAMFGQWGKATHDLPESLSAGVAMRALAVRRGQVLFAEASDVTFDPLQVLLVLTHWMGKLQGVSAPAAAESAGVRALLPAKGPCDDVVDKANTGLDDALKGGLNAGVGSAAKQVGEAVGKAVGAASNTAGAGTDALSTLLLLLGAQLDVDDDHGHKTHFKHKPSETSKHVMVTAAARFDSAIAAKNIACYSLAGITVPPSGPLKNFRVRWKMAQAEAQMDQDPTVPPSTLAGLPQGKYLATTHADSNKLQDGELTDGAGLATLNLKPPTEEKPGEGQEHSGTATVTAYLDKQDFPLKASDLWGLLDPLAGGLMKTISLVFDMITKAGLPSKSDTITVTYHGVDIYQIKGSSDVDPFKAVAPNLISDAPTTVDVYTCTGLDGEWEGMAKMIVNVGLLPQAAGEVTGKSLPKSGELANDHVKFNLNDSYDPILLISPVNGNTVRAKITIDRQPKQDEHLDGPIGSAELFLGDISLDAVGQASQAFRAKYPIVGVDEDTRCKGGKSYFDAQY